MDGRVRALWFVTLEPKGCMVCISHRPDPSGYMVLGWGNSRTASRRRARLHRLVYAAHHGEPAPGYEVDHTCHTRLCCNPAHLTALTVAEHRAISNGLRNAKRLREARAYWLVHKPPTAALAVRFGVSQAAAAMWVRSWGGGRPRGPKHRSNRQ